MYPVWANNDQVTAYTVDGTTQAHVVVQALHHSVTLAATRRPTQAPRDR